MNMVATKKHRGSVSLFFSSPFDWAGMLDFYRLRAIEGLELIDENSYQRHFELEGSKGWFKASRVADTLQVEYEMDAIAVEDNAIKNNAIEESAMEGVLIIQLRRMFNLDVDIDAVEAHLNAVSPGIVLQSGLRIPGVWNTWEAGVRAILGQQVSIKAAIGQLNLLTVTLSQGEISQDHLLNETTKGGDESNVGHCSILCFPTPYSVANADLSFLRMPQSRKDTLKRVADFTLTYPNAHPNDWLSLKGIGPWTVNYALLRGLSEPNCFLDSDLVVKKTVAQRPEMTKENVAPWGSYATYHCWRFQS